MNEATKAANAALKAKMDAAGYTEQEQILGTLTAEFKAALAMVESVRHPMAVVAVMAISSTVSKILAYTTKQLGGGDSDGSVKMAHRVVAVSDMVMDDCMRRALGDCDPECEGQSGEQSAPGAVISLESFRRPTEAKDIN